jgi:hypothetical protein
MSCQSATDAKNIDESSIKGNQTTRERIKAIEKKAISILSK